MLPFCSPPNFKFKYFYSFHNFSNFTPLVMFHDVNSGSNSATTSTLCNLLGPLCALPIQNVVLVIYHSHLRGTNSKASPLGSLIDFINDFPNLEFIIPLEQPNPVFHQKQRKKNHLMNLLANSKFHGGQNCLRLNYK